MAGADERGNQWQKESRIEGSRYSEMQREGLDGDGGWKGLRDTSRLNSLGLTSDAVPRREWEVAFTRRRHGMGQGPGFRIL